MVVALAKRRWFGVVDARVMVEMMMVRITSGFERRCLVTWCRGEAEYGGVSGSLGRGRERRK